MHMVEKYIEVAGCFSKTDFKAQDILSPECRQKKTELIINTKSI